MPIDSSGNYWIARDSSGTYSADYYMALARNIAPTIVSYNNTVNRLVTGVSLSIDGVAAYYNKTISDPDPVDAYPTQHLQSTIDAIGFLFRDGMNEFVSSAKRFTQVFIDGTNANFNVRNLDSALLEFQGDFSGNLVYSPYYLYQGSGPPANAYAITNSDFLADANNIKNILFEMNVVSPDTGEYDADIQNFMDKAKAMKVAFDALKNSLEAEPTTPNMMSLDPDNPYYPGFKDYTLKNYYIFLHNLFNNTLSFDLSNNLLYNRLSFDSSDNAIYTLEIDSSNNPLPVLDSSNNRIPVPGFPGTFRTYTNIYNRLRFDSSNNIIIPAFPGALGTKLLSLVGTARTIIEQIPQAPPPPTFVSQITDSSGVTRIKFRGDTTQVPQAPFVQAYFEYDSSGGANPRYPDASGNSSYTFVDIFNASYVADTTKIFNYPNYGTGINPGVSVDASGICFAEFIFGNPIIRADPYTISWYLENGNAGSVPNKSAPARFTLTPTISGSAPGTPNAPTLVSKTTTTIVVRTSTTGVSGSRPSSYRFRATDSSNNTFDSTGNEALDASGNYTDVIDGLSAGRSYNITVTLFNAFGNSTSSATQIVTGTGPGTPNAPTLVSKTLTSLTVRSSTTGVSGGPFTSCVFVATGNLVNPIGDPPDASGNYTVTYNSLQSATEYTITFSLYNQYGSRDSSTSQFRTASPVSTPPVPTLDSATTTSLTILSNSNGITGGPFIEIRFKAVDSSGATITSIASSDSSGNVLGDASGNYTGTITGLRGNTPYSISVIYKNQYGQSESSTNTPLVATTNVPSLPGSPDAPILVSATPNSVTLRVDTNGVSGGPFTGYIFRAIYTLNIDSSGNKNVDASGNYSSSANVAPDGSGNYTATITGLSSTRLYEAYAILKNSDGNSNDGTPIIVSALGTPGTPPAPILGASDSNSLFVVVNLQGTLGGYFDTRRFTITDSSGYSYFQNATGNQSFVYATNFIGLPPSKTYQISITISNSFGTRTSASLTASTTSIPTYSPHIDTIVSQTITTLNGYSTTLDQINGILNNYYYLAFGIASYDSIITNTSGDSDILHSLAVRTEYQAQRMNITDALQGIDDIRQAITAFKIAIGKFIDNLNNLDSQNLNLSPGTYNQDINTLYDMNNTFNGYFQGLAYKLSTWSVTYLQQLSNNDTAWNNAGTRDQVLDDFINNVSNVLLNPFPTTNPVDTTPITTDFQSGTSYTYIVAEPRAPSIPSLLSITTNGTSILLKVRGNRNSILEGYFSAVYFNLTTAGGSSYANVNTLQTSSLLGDSSGNFIETFTFTPGSSVYNTGELASITWGAVNVNNGINVNMYNGTDASNNIIYNASDPLFVVLRPPQPSIPNAPLLVSATTNTLTLRNDASGITGTPLSDVKFTALDSNGNLRRVNASNSQDASGNYVADSTGNYTATITGLSTGTAYNLRTILNNGNSPSTSAPLTASTTTPPPGTPNAPTQVSVTTTSITVRSSTTGISGSPFTAFRFRASDSSNSTFDSSGNAAPDASGNYNATIGGLTSGRLYSVTTTLFNISGNTTSSATQITTTSLPGTPPAPTFVSKTSSSITVRSNSNSVSGGTFTQVAFTATDSSGSTLTSNAGSIDASGNYTATISGINRGSIYYRDGFTVTVRYSNTNGQGRVSAPLTLVVPGVPPAPIFVSKTSTSITTRISTTGIKGAPFTGYIFGVEDKFDAQIGKVFFTVDGPPDASGNYIYTATGLLPNREYGLEVGIFNVFDIIGSDAIVIRTSPAGPPPGTPPAPTFVSRAEDYSSLTVRSNSNSISGGPFTLVTFTAKDSSDNIISSISASSKDSSGNYDITFTELTGEQFSYGFNVTVAYSSANGQGGVSAPLNVLRPGNGTAPTAIFVSKTSTTITTRISTTGVTGGPFTGYIIKVEDVITENEDERNFSSANGAPDASGNYISTNTGLLPDRQYGLRVSLYNIFGFGTSPPIIFRTNAFLGPGTPSAPKLVSLTPNSVTLRLNTNGLSRGPFTGYIFRAIDTLNIDSSGNKNVDASGNYSSSANVAPDGSGNYTVTITGLSSTRFYKAYAILKNSNGDSNDGNQITVSGLGIPGTPPVPILIASDFNSLVVGINLEGVLGGYFDTTRFIITDSSGYSYFQNAIANYGNAYIYSTNFIGLPPSTTYQIAFTVSNSFGARTSASLTAPTASIPTYSRNIDVIASEAITRLQGYSDILGQISVTLQTYYVISQNQTFNLEDSIAGPNSIKHSAQVLSAFQNLKGIIVSSDQAIGTMLNTIQTMYFPAFTEFIADLNSLYSVNINDPDASNYDGVYFAHLSSLIDANSNFTQEFNNVRGIIASWSLTALQNALANTDSAWNTANGGPDSDLAGYILNISTVLTNNPFPTTNPINTTSITSNFGSNGTALGYIVAEPRAPSIPSLLSITIQGTSILLKVRGNRNSMLEGYFSGIYFTLESQAGSYANVNTVYIDPNQISNGNFVGTFTFTPGSSVYNIGDIVSITWGAINVNNGTDVNFENGRDSSNNIIFNASDPLLVILRPPQPSIPNPPTLVSATSNSLTLRNNATGIRGVPFSDVKFTAFDTSGNVRRANASNTQDPSGNYVADTSGNYTGTITGLISTRSYDLRTILNNGFSPSTSEPFTKIASPGTPRAPIFISNESGRLIVSTNPNGISGAPFDFIIFEATDSSGNTVVDENYSTDGSGNYIGTLEISPLRRYNVSVIFINAGGSSRSSSTSITTVQVEPSSPSAPTLVANGSTYVSLNLDVLNLGGEPFIGCEFNFTDSSDNLIVYTKPANQSGINPPDSSGSYNITTTTNLIKSGKGLTPLTYYDVTATIYNDLGSKESRATSLTTLPYATVASLVSRTSTSVTLSNQLLYDTTGALITTPITVVKINYTDSSGNYSRDASGNIKTATTSKDTSGNYVGTITGLTSGRSYRTFYSFTDGSGNLYSSVPLNVTTLAASPPGTPAAPTQVSVTGSSITVRSSTTGISGSPFNAFRFRATDSSNNTFDSSGNAPPDASGNYIATIGGLTSGRVYSVTTTLFNQFGNTTSSGTSITAGGGSPPGTPAAPTQVSVTGSSITVRSSTTGISGSPFNAFRFRATDSSNNTFDSSGNGAPDASGNYSATIGGLASGRVYSVTTTLFNTFGNTTSVGTSITTGSLPGTPNAPTQVSVTSTSLTVRASTTGVSGSPFTAFRFRATDSSNNTFDSSGNEAPDSSGNYTATIGGLASGRAYSVTTNLSNIYGNTTSVGTSITTGGVPGTPNAPTEVSVTGSSITVRASTTGVSGSPFTAFRFRATDSSNNTFDSSGNVAPDSSGNYSATIGGLVTSRVYSVTTNLSNIYGNTTSLGTSITTGGIPGTPNAPIFISRTTSSITVRASTTGISGGPFNAYRFRATDSSGIYSDSTANGPPDSSGNYTATINSLFSGKLYNVVTTLYNIYGNTTGPGTDIISGTIPSIPNHAILVRNGSTSVTIRNNTNSIGSPFTQCDFVLRDTNSNAVTYTIDGAPDSSGYYILTTPGIELTPLTTYNIYTTFYNEFGSATSLSFLILTTLIQSSQPTIVSVGTNSIVVISNLSRDTAGFPVIRPITNVAINYEQNTSTMMFASFASNSVSGTGTVSGPDGSGNYTGTITGLSSSSNYNVYFSFTNVAGQYTSAPVAVTTRSNGICFKTGSKILCLKDCREQYVPVEELRRGDLVKILSGEYIKINLIGKSMIDNPDNGDRGPNRLFILRRANYPDLNEDLIITGCHSRLVDKLTDKQRNRHLHLMSNLYMTTGKFRLMAFIDEKAEPYRDPGVHEIWHFALDNENEVCNYGVYANGLLVETASIKSMRKIAGINLL